MLEFRRARPDSILGGAGEHKDQMKSVSMRQVIPGDGASALKKFYNLNRVVKIL